jgi:chorismate mutase
VRGEAAAAARDLLRRMATATFFLSLAGCAAQPPAADVEKIDRVLVLIQQRLGYMDDVARNKWNSGAAIEDLPREREIIEGIGRQAPGYGLDPAIARGFFRAQIEASKIIQRARFAEWRAQNQPQFTNLPDLRDRIRPALDALTPEMLKALAAAMPALQTPGSAAVVNARAAVIVTVIPADVPARDAAVAPLKALALP